MPKLRKRSNVLYNEEQISELEFNKQSASKSVNYGSTLGKIPNVVISGDGKRFFPCRFCCRAFANERQHDLHIKTCTYRTQGNTTKISLKTALANAIEVKTENAQTNRKRQLSPTETAEETDRSEGMITRANGKTYLVPQKYSKLETKEKEEEKRRSITETTTCKYCQETFHDGIQLLRHKRAVHAFPRILVAPEELEYYNQKFLKSDRKTCVLCGRPLGQMNWKRHLLTHSNERNYECRICKKTFARIDHRNAHEGRHVISVEDAICE